MDVVLRSAEPRDSRPAGEICYEAFKSIAEHHAFPADFPEPGAAIALMEHLHARKDVFGVTAELDGRTVGTNFLWEDEDVAGIGPITIEPAMQNTRVGRRLMEAVLERARAQGILRVRLVQAAYHSRSLSLYTKLGFEAREPLSVFQGPALASGIPGHQVRLAGPADIESAESLCRRVNGHRRTGELRAAIDQKIAQVVEREGRITGYTTGVGFFGHTVGEGNSDVQALIAAAKTFDGPGFLVPTRNTALMRWCLERGLKIVQPMTLMTIGPYQEPCGAVLPSVLF